MDSQLEQIARTCLDGAESNTLTFPQIVGALTREGFENYEIDYRRSTAIYFMPEGDSIVLTIRNKNNKIAAALDATALRAAILEAQQLVPGYTYAGFCAKAMAAGCAE